MAKQKNYWLLKSEPESFSIQDLEKAPKKTTTAKKDKPYFDPVAYGNGPDDSIAATEADENAALTHHSVTIGGAKIAYTARITTILCARTSRFRTTIRAAYRKYGIRTERIMPSYCVKQTQASATRVEINAHSTSDSARNGKYSRKSILNSSE